MNQIFSVILVIVMAFSSMAGVTAGIEGAVSFDAKISMDTEAVLNLAAASGTDVPEEAKQGYKVAGDILNALTLKGTATKDTAELALLAGEDVALSIGMKADEKGTTVASNLLSTDVIFVSAELIEQMKQQAAQSVSTSGVNTGALEAVQNVDREQISKDCAEVGEKLTQAIEARKGEAETGEFTVDGLTFTARTPVNMTYKEFVELLLTSVKELAEKESLKPLMQMNGQDIGAEIDKAIENLKNQPEEQQPVLDLAIYTDADNCAYYVCSMAKADAAENSASEKVYLAFGEVNSLSRAHVAYEQNGQTADITFAGTREGACDLQAAINDGNTKVDITASKDEAGKLSMVCVIKTAADDVKLVISSEPAEGERVSFSADVYYGGAEKPLLTITGSAGKGGEIVSVFEGETINVVPFEALADESNTTVSGQLQMKMMAGLLKCITVVTKNMPEDTAAWINGQIRQMMSPKTTTTTPKGE